ncbi:MAG: phenylphosphate carboxylase subunit delta, partial [Bacteriovoracaceae bacterium]|nr:phenylphosphate carboxylase subunit delta [Bacteriovoracaceae bacterium]
SQPGGHGAVREAAEIILKRLGLFEKAMERYVG